MSNKNSIDTLNEIDNKKESIANTNKPLGSNSQSSEINMCVDNSIDIDNVFNQELDITFKIWGQVLLEMKSNNDNLLYAMCGNVIRTEMVGDTLNLVVNNDRDYQALSDIDNLERLQNYVMRFTDKKVQIILDHKENKQNADIEYLKGKFGDKLVVKLD